MILYWRMRKNIWHGRRSCIGKKDSFALRPSTVMSDPKNSLSLTNIASVWRRLSAAAHSHSLTAGNWSLIIAIIMRTKIFIRMHSGSIFTERIWSVKWRKHSGSKIHKLYWCKYFPIISHRSYKNHILKRCFIFWDFWDASIRYGKWCSKVLYSEDIAMTCNNFIYLYRAPDGCPVFW